MMAEPGRRTAPEPGAGGEGTCGEGSACEAAPGLHEHVHQHADGTVHVHVHHHRHTYDPALRLHEHTHDHSFESLASIVSPLAALDARTKLIAALIVILALVLTPPVRLVEFGLLVGLVLALVTLGRLPARSVLARSALVLPFAGTIALMAPVSSGGSVSLGGYLGPDSAPGWLVAWGVLSRAWLSTVLLILVAATTPAPALLEALRRMRVPGVLVTLLAFIHRYARVLGAQVRAMRIAIASRAPRLGRVTLVRTYGQLAGAMVVRAFERGERIHAAMVARGFDGSLSSASPGRFRATDVLTIGCAILIALAVMLY